MFVDAIIECNDVPNRVGDESRRNETKDLRAESITR